MKSEHQLARQLLEESCSHKRHLITHYSPLGKLILSQYNNLGFPNEILLKYFKSSDILSFRTRDHLDKVLELVDWVCEHAEYSVWTQDEYNYVFIAGKPDDIFAVFRKFIVMHVKTIFGDE